MPTIDYSGSNTSTLTQSPCRLCISTRALSISPHVIDKNGNLYSSEDVNNPILGLDETAYTLEEARSSGADVSDVFSDVLELADPVRSYHAISTWRREVYQHSQRDGT